MNEKLNERKEKLEEYSARHTFWTQQVLTQLGYSINIFFTIGIAFLGYLVSIQNNFQQIRIDLDSSINWNTLLYLLSIVSIFASVLLGSISITSRLYDLRITRHLTWARKRHLKEDHSLLPENKDLKTYPVSLMVKNYLKSMFREINFMVKADFNNKDLIASKFNKLAIQGRILGQTSWSCHKIQIFMVLISTVLYVLSFL